MREPFENKTYTNLWELGHYMTSIKINVKLFNFYMVATFPSLRFFHTEPNQLICQDHISQKRARTQTYPNGIREKCLDPLHFQNSLFLIVGRRQSFNMRPLIPLFVGLLMTSALGFKATVEPLFLSLLTCMQWIPQIHLWCDTCYPLDGQHGGRVFLIHTLAQEMQAPPVEQILRNRSM